MRVIEVSMEQRRNEKAGETGDLRENPPTNGIVRMRKYGVIQQGIKHGPLCAFEEVKRGSDKDVTDTRGLCPFAPTSKALNWRAVFPLCCVYLWDFKRLEAEKRKSDRDDTTTQIKCAVAAKRKALNGPTVL
ncbi:hypothetical protein PR048_008189 [Dryococelus australis]|uniref:Uncharacterized protein n=1 Tax=Dryococelus australis TaxID=614101 RepID=A0ABQ9HWQ7_9NEOP|nr:hypothetical protein PR048_008189 [Dryococelus australis]